MGLRVEAHNKSLIIFCNILKNGSNHASPLSVSKSSSYSYKMFRSMLPPHLNRITYLFFRDPFANFAIISPSSSSSALSLLPLTGFIRSALSLSLSFCSALRCFFSALASNFASAASSSETRPLTIVLSICSSVLRPSKEK
jgi:hypothetical protein